MCLFPVLGYSCQLVHCKWSEYKKNVDWGIYSNATNSDCASCRKRCNVDLNCTGIECGRAGEYSHCSWWKGKSCSHNEERVVLNEKFETCMKVNEGN